MSAIGILGGMGPQASTRLLRLLIEGTQKYTPAAFDDDYPEIILLNVPVPNFISNKNQLPNAKNILIERTKLLEIAGSTINGIACNTAHILLPELQAVTNVPFLSLPKLVAIRITANNYKRVGLLATPTTLHSTLYDEALDSIAKLIRPNTKLTKMVERYIYKQLNGTLSTTDQKDFRLQLADFKQTNNLDAIILGCTELPLVYGKTNDPSVLDTLQILSDSLLAYYYK